jgi:hypothetical protein
MPSPFPGMDPYLESPSFWGGFHSNLYNRIQTALNAQLPDGYYADIEEYVWLQEDQSEERLLLGRPDAFVTEKNGRSAPSSGKGGVATYSLPERVSLPKAAKRKHRLVKIVGPDNQTVVTVIEVLSPSNKERGIDREKYLNKRDEYLGSGTNFIEIDLLRDGGRMPLGKPSPRTADYYIFVCRGKNYPDAEVWPFTIRDQIPLFPVPLKPDDGETPLDIQSCITEIYKANRYSMRIDYSNPPTPPFSPVDAEWASERLKSTGAKKQKKSSK